MASISLVAIVKNEEKILAKMIENVKPIVDEIIIVDTGSTDDTRNIIEHYGTLYEMEFTNFVDTKNYAISLATSDYILIMDADETISSGLERLKQAAEDGVVAMNALIIETNGTVVTNEYYRPRLWKRCDEWKFVGPGVHEIPGGPGEQSFDPEIKVHHDHSHRGEMDMTARFNMYVDILENHLKDNPTDPRALFYLGRTHSDLNNRLQAIEAFGLYLDRRTDFKDERWQATIDIAINYLALGEYDLAIKWANKAIEVDCRRAESLNLLGSIAFKLENWEEAIGYYKQTLALEIPEDVVLFFNRRAYKEIPLDMLSLIYSYTKEYRKGLEATKKLIEFNNTPDIRILENLNWYLNSNSMTIFMTLGKTPEPVYGGIIEEKGVGGVETTYVELGRTLTELGHNVYIFSECEEEHVYDGVNYLPFKDIVEVDILPDVIISSRWFDSFFVEKFKDATKILWFQDAYFAEPREHTFDLVNGIVCSSRWHYHYIKERYQRGVPKNKLNIIQLGIDKLLFPIDVEKNPNKVLYSSNPDRGLYILADMWPRISAMNPEIELAITYGWEGLVNWREDEEWKNKIESDKTQLMDWAEKCGNVTFTGRLKKADLYKEMASCSLCLYPNNFWETFCITGIETQYCGTPMITSNMGALTTTLSHEGNILINDSPHGEYYQREFVSHTQRLLSNYRERKDMAKKGNEFVRDGEYDWTQIASIWETYLYSLR